MSFSHVYIIYFDHVQPTFTISCHHFSSHYSLSSFQIVSFLLSWILKIFLGTSIMISIAARLIYNSILPVICKCPFLPHSGQHLLLFLSLMRVILTGVKWNLNVVLICNSLTPKDVDFFVYLWPFLLL
jgi:hypothetical protein